MIMVFIIIYLLIYIGWSYEIIIGYFMRKNCTFMSTMCIDIYWRKAARKLESHRLRRYTPILYSFSSLFFSSFSPIFLSLTVHPTRISFGVFELTENWEKSEKKSGVDISKRSRVLLASSQFTQLTLSFSSTFLLYIHTCICVCACVCWSNGSYIVFFFLRFKQYLRRE